MRSQIKKKVPEPSAREKGILFAKSNIPKPKQAKNPEELTLKKKKDIVSSSPFKDEYAKLNQNHQLYSEEVRKMKQEFASLFP